MLEISNLKSGYNGMEILHGVSIKARPSEVVSIIGPNGSGKSTLLKSIFSLASVYSGSIVFMKKDVKGLKTHELIGEGISYVPQGRQVFSTLTVRENLEVSAFIYREKSLVNKRIGEVFRRFPFLEQKQKDYAFTLSGGQQQMLAIARSLMQSPKLLLLDEPSLGLSPKAMKDVFRKIAEINRGGVSIILVEQNARQSVKIADRTYVLEDGRIALEAGKEILDEKRLRDIYFGGR